MTTTVPLAEHVDRPEQRHRLTALDGQRLRCHDCSRTLVLPTGPGSTSHFATPSSALPDLSAPPRPRDACHQHPGQHAQACAGCAADAKAAGQPPPPAGPTSSARARAAARQALADALGRRTVQIGDDDGTTVPQHHVAGEEGSA